MFTEAFYTALGKAVYGLAMADGNVQTSEIEMLKEKLKIALTKMETQTDEFGVNLAYYVLFSFETELENQRPGTSAMDEFFDYLTEHQPVIDEDMEFALLKLLQTVAEANRKLDQDELRALQSFQNRLRTYLDRKV